MKLRRDKPAIPDNDILRQETVQSLLKRIGFDAGVADEIGCLPQCMHTGICPAGADQDDFLPGHGFNGGFNRLLNGGSVGLALPAMVAASIVFNNEFEILNHRTATKPARFSDAAVLDAVAPQIGQGRFHAVVHLIQQIDKGEGAAASLAAP